MNPRDSCEWTDDSCTARAGVTNSTSSWRKGLGARCTNKPRIGITFFSNLFFGSIVFFILKNNIL